MVSAKANPISFQKDIEHLTPISNLDPRTDKKMKSIQLQGKDMNGVTIIKVSNLY